MSSLEADSPVDHVEELIELYPPITEALMIAMRANFKPLRITPETSREKTMYHAGIQRVVERLAEVKQWQEHPDG